MQDAKEEVRSRLNIEDIIGEYVHLKRAGRNFRGLSPFTSEKTPSFYVSPDKQIWHDFSSNKGGDLFTFVMEMEGIDFRASLEHLARKAGVDLSMFQSRGDNGLAELKKKLLAINELAATYYQHSLLSNQHAVDYVFKKRRLDKNIVSIFRIGYAPDSGDALVNFLKKKGFEAKDIADAGLANRFGGDLFRGRMTVPLMDGVGQIVGFTGRIMIDDPKAPKYLNTPQTVLYDKGRHVFGLSQAKEAIRKADNVVLVEGNLDVVSSHQAGIKNVVATAGTAMTIYHLKALVRLTQKIKLAFDGDKAGVSATERSIPIAQSIGADLSVVEMIDGAKDPDELIKRDPKLWQGVIEKDRPAMDWLIEQYASKEDLKQATGKRRFTTIALGAVRAINDPVEREHYLQKVAKMVDSSLATLDQKVSNTENTASREVVLKKRHVSSEPLADKKLIFQDNLLALLLLDKASRDLVTGLSSDVFEGDDRRAVFQFVIKHPEKVIADVLKNLQKYDIYVKILLLKADTRYGDWSEKDRYYESAELVRKVMDEHTKIQKHNLITELSRLEAEGNEVSAAEVRSRLSELIKEKRNSKTNQ
jgi:DNA primase